MHWPQVFFSSFSPSSSSPSSSASSKTGDQRIDHKLTRQTNLRYLSEREITDSLHLSSDGDPASTAEVIPQPLPLPEYSNVVFRRTGGSPDSRPDRGDRPLPSPKQTSIVRDRGDGAIDGSPHAQGDKDLIWDPTEMRTSRRVHQNASTAENSSNKFKINVPTGISPISPFTSPSISPPRMSSGDLFPYYYITPKTNQIWSAPEMPTGTALPIYPDYVTFSRKSSSLHNPQMKSPLTGSSRSTGVLSPISQRESYSQTSVHPLPLPPAAPILSPVNSSPHAAIKPGVLPIKGQWQKGKLIGRGTFGSVYVASNLETGALCTMKEVELFPDDPKSIECMKQLEQEIKVLSCLKHPNIVQYYGSEIIEDRFYIYLEYVHPRSIDKYVREHCGAITESVVRSFTRHILSGLAYLHSKKTIHRDIKGANMLVDASGVVKLVDFGMAKHLLGQAYDLSLKGSPYWMAPEAT
ncbi:hypothetical protein SAY87_020411 [Trapa incisa]|uniref:Protein kinase domain-containing protein n=1 Tax=Trapa incisa TaxID=236973 RepID=A0AAN7Q8U7_9MYRT|nr:hypothetical protein SAY87_020411 [Trapa incisa]